MNIYETDSALQEYLLFHYGSDQEVLPYSFGPFQSLHFPIRCVSACLPMVSSAKALDLGCAVGRSSFELTRYCEKVVAIDNSQRFISAAQHIQQHGSLEYSIAEEGFKTSSHLARLPPNVHPQKVEFQCCDVMALEVESFDIVLAANLICRLPNPQAFLQRLPQWVAPKGKLILTSPYSWLETFTPKECWLCSENESSLDRIQAILKDHFTLQHYFDLPFLIREHRRKYQWCIAQTSIWLRKQI